MSRWIILSATVVVLTAIMTFAIQYVPESIEGPDSPAPAATAGPHPKLVIDQDVAHNFGTMSQQTKAKHTWKVSNTGDGDLEIWLEGHTSCSCTVASLGEGKKEVVKPGASKDIDLEWNTKTFKDDYTQTATIGTNDPSRPTFTLMVRGKVYPPVVLVPSEVVAFGSISNEEPHTIKLAVFSLDRPIMKVTGATSSRPNLIGTKIEPLSAEDCKKLQVQAGYKVEVEVKPGMPLGHFNDELVVKTDHPQRSEIKVAISGSATGPITLVPDNVRLPNVKARSGASKEITLMVRGGQTTNFKVGYKPKNIEVAIAANNDNPAMKGRYRLTITVPPGASPGWINDQIILETDHPKANELKIPVNIFVSNTGAS